MAAVYATIERNKTELQALDEARRQDPNTALQLIHEYEEAYKKLNDARKKHGCTNVPLCRQGGRGDYRPKAYAKNTIKWHEARCRCLKEQLEEANLWPLASELCHGQLALPLF